MSNLEFINKINEKFSNNISCLTDFVSYRKSTNTEFHCNIHNERFNMSAQNILRTKTLGCPYCSGTKYNKKIINDIFKKQNKKIEIVKYDKTDSVNTDLEFICKEHGKFTSKLRLVLDYKTGCPICGSKQKDITKKEKTLKNLKEKLVGTTI